MQALAEKVIATAKSKRDFAVDTRRLTFLPTGDLSLSVQGKEERFQVTDHCLAQVVDRVGVPQAYAKRMLKESPSLLALNINHWFAAAPDVRMLRTIAVNNPTARAFLSHRYRPFDNHDLVQHCIPKLVEAGCEVKSCEVTDKFLYLQATTPRVTGEVKVGDVVQAGVTLSNSEIGCRSIAVEPLIFRLSCLNGMVMKTALRRHHVGRGGEGAWGGDEALEVFSDRTRQLDDQAFWAKVKDVIDDVLKPEKFARHLEVLRDAARGNIGKPLEAVEILSDRYSFDKQEKDSVLQHLVRGGDLSQWGLANAVTAAANTMDSYDRSIDFERIGGEIVELPQSTFGN